MGHALHKSAPPAVRQCWQAKTTKRWSSDQVMAGAFLLPPVEVVGRRQGQFEGLRIHPPELASSLRPMGGASRPRSIDSSFHFDSIAAWRCAPSDIRQNTRTAL